MNLTLLGRYIYNSRYYYLTVIFIYIAALSCGISHAGAVCRSQEAQVYSYTIWSIILKNAVPLLAIGLGGLFFAGSLLIFSSVCYSAYMGGFIIGTQFAVSFWCGAAYVFLCAIPLGIIYMCCTVFGAVTAFQCNMSRYTIRRKGLARPMTNYEIRTYLGKIMLVTGINVVAVILEYYVFAAAYVNLVS